MKLDVYSNAQLAGTLEQVDLTRYVFSYAPGAKEDAMVSLLMPIRTESWIHRFLHPVFQVSLPEGALRQVLTKKFAKRFDRFGETELLATIGSHLIGRLKVVPHGTRPNPEAPEESLRDLLKESPAEMLEHYLQLHAEYSGVSGGFAKFLARSPSDDSANQSDEVEKNTSAISTSPQTSKSLNGQPYCLSHSEEDVSKTTLTFDHWIVKGNSPDHPDLVLNEYFGLLMARRMGLTVPAFHLSEDAQRIAIERFDVGPNGEHFGFEDMCALHGLNASDKFSGSVERVINTISTFCSPQQADTDRLDFYAQYVACMAIRNGDAHLKNFGLLYTTRTDARLCPVYDMVSMSVYAPVSKDGDALDEPAMSLDGVRRWPTEKSLKYLAARCMLSPSRQATVRGRLCEAMIETSQDIASMAADRPSFEPVAKRMLELWACGLALHSPQHAQKIRDLAGNIENDQAAYEERPRLRF